MDFDPFYFLRADEKTAVFIDGANLYSAAKNINLELDFKKLREVLIERTNILRIFYYTAMLTDKEQYNPIKQLTDWLDYNGYTMVTKPLKEYTRGESFIRKGNMDIELAIDVMRSAGFVDHIILFSGDGDFRRLVETVQNQGCRVTVIATYDNVADELRRQCDNFVVLGDIGPAIQRVSEPGQSRETWQDRNGERG